MSPEFLSPEFQPSYVLWLPRDAFAMTSWDSIVGDNGEDTRLLRRMAADARDYLHSFKWCPRDVEFRLAFGVGGVVAVFLALMPEKIGGTDDRLWVVVGDLPSAYLVVEADDSVNEALERYCDMMDGWIEAVEAGGPFESVFPVQAARTKENASALRARVGFVRGDIMPKMDPASLARRL